VQVLVAQELLVNSSPSFVLTFEVLRAAVRDTMIGARQ
jgi:hypothetical protein